MNTRPIARKAIAPLAGMSPAYFGMVMATGIVSLATHFLDMQFIADALFQLNVVVYVVLWLLTVLRMVLYPSQFFADMTDHLRGPGFFTVVAATGILGGQFVILKTDYHTATVLWAAALLFWLVLTYTVFTGLTVKAQKPSLDKGISGGWLLAVVATQSIAVLSALLAAHVIQLGMLGMNFLALSMWLCGGMLYLWIITLIFYRYLFLPVSVEDLSPSLWINMGATAISTVAGSLLVINASGDPYLASLLPFIKGFTVLYWATGTWWIPMLVILSFWRHVYKRFPLKYEPLYWGAVFPLGMYAVCTKRMIDAMEFHFLAFLPTLFVYIALAAWTVIFVGFALDVLRRIRVLRL